MMIGEIKQEDTASAYAPSKEVADFLGQVFQKDYAAGDGILNREWTELNDRSVIEDMNRGQKTFNAFVDESVDDPSESWKWIGTRSKARNKAIAMHAQLTAGYVVPMFMAQNEDDTEDRDFSDIMRDIAEWMVDNSEYKSSYLMITLAMLMNPVSYLGAEYCQVYQTIREKTAKGYEKKEILDDVLSGFKAPIWSANQILISNAYERNIQKQRFVIKRRFIDYSEAKAKYGEHKDWGFVAPGIRTIMNSTDNLFYDTKDDEHPALVSEEIWYSRREDTEIPVVGGIYMGRDNIEENPVKHRDYLNRPKYNIVPFGYQRITEHFFFYKSLMNAMYWDDRLIDAQYEMAMNRVFLDTNMPIAVSGTDKIDSDIIFPSSVVAVKDKDFRVQPILPQANISGIFQAMKATEESMEESSISDTASGQLPAATQKATSVALAERNARTLLEGVGKSIAESIVQYGDLMSDIAVNFLSVPEIAETLGENVKLKYRSFVLKNKMVKGREMTKTLRFDESLLGKKMTPKQKKYANLKLLNKEGGIGYPDNREHLIFINPELFARKKYLTRVEPQKIFPKNEEYMQAINSQMYAQLRNDPLISAEPLVRRVVHSWLRGEGEELINKQQPTQMNQIAGLLGKPPQTQFAQQAINTKTAQGLTL